MSTSPNASANARPVLNPLQPEPRTRQVSTLEGHALWADTYDGAANPLLALEELAMEPLLPDLAGQYVADLACGTGRWLEKLLRRGAREALGVDFCERRGCAGVEQPRRAASEPQ